MYFGFLENAAALPVLKNKFFIDKIQENDGEKLVDGSMGKFLLKCE